MYRDFCNEDHLIFIMMIHLLSRIQLYIETDSCFHGTLESRDQSRYAPSQWESSLQCNDISHWLVAYLDWSLGESWYLTSGVSVNRGSITERTVMGLHLYKDGISIYLVSLSHPTMLLLPEWCLPGSPWSQPSVKTLSINDGMIPWLWSQKRWQVCHRRCDEANFTY